MGTVLVLNPIQGSVEALPVPIDFEADQTSLSELVEELQTFETALTSYYCDSGVGYVCSTQDLQRDTTAYISLLVQYSQQLTALSMLHSFILTEKVTFLL